MTVNSQFDDFVTATPSISTFRDFDSSVTVRNENEYENDFYDDLTELRTEGTEWDVPETMFESSSCCSETETEDSSEGYPALPYTEVGL